VHLYKEKNKLFVTEDKKFSKSGTMVAKVTDCAITQSKKKMHLNLFLTKKMARSDSTSTVDFLVLMTTSTLDGFG